VRQVGYLQRLYRDARSTEHKIDVHLVFTNALKQDKLISFSCWGFL